MTYVIAEPCVDVRGRACVDDLGSPGGATKLGALDRDHPLIASLPPSGEG